jgi:hypothetical protein
MRKNVYTFLFLFITTICFAGSFTPGNLVLVRVGTGPAQLSSAATAVFLDEYTPAGVLVQSIAMPTAENGSNHILTLSGTATSEGSLTLSVNGQLLVLAGYDAATGTASVSSDSTVNRTIATVSATGTVNTATGIVAGDAYKKNNIRGAATQDGTAFWCAGAGSGTTGGTWYVTAGSVTSSPVDISSTISSTRVVNIFNGQLYTSSSSSSFHGVNSVGTGIPTTAGQTSANLAGMPAADTASSQYAFLFANDSLLYVCDDHTTSGGGVLKYSLVSGTWVSNGNISSLEGLRGITGYQTCAGVKLFISGQGGVFSLTDNSGYNATITGTLNQLVTPDSNTVYRGIAFAPGTTAPTALTANATATDVTCNNAANGSVSATITGGTTPYSFSWSNSSTTQNISNLAPNTYTITVTDAGGCTASASASVTQPGAISAVPTPTNVACFGGTTGGVSLTVTGGSSVYTYSWTGGATTQNLSNVGMGTYDVTVTDSHSCTGTATASVTQPAQITIAPTVTNLPCTGGAGTGAVNITVTGGTGSDTYSWSNGATTQNITGLNANTFTVTVTDANHCTAAQSATVSQAGSMMLTTEISEVSCNGGNNGAIDVTASGGTPAYSYSWSNSSTAQTISSLAPNTYTVTVTDQGGCTLINSFTITQPAALIATTTPTEVSCYGGSNGAINLSVNGGTTPYTFSWSSSSTTQNLANLTAGSYSVVVTDSNSCTASNATNVTQPDSIAISGVVTNATAFGDADGSIALTVTGGTAGYTYSWNSGTGADNTGLAAASYCVTVTDAHTCTASDCFVVTQPTGINQTSLTQKFIVYPVADNLVLTADLRNIQQCNVLMRDIMGRIIFSSAPTVTSQIQMQIPAGNISAGCYIITINAEEGTQSKKVVVTH